MKKPWLNSLSLITQMGILMITPILICLFIGIFLDDTFNKTPLFTIIFLILGTLAAFRNLLHEGTKQIKKNEKDNKKERENKNDE